MLERLRAFAVLVLLTLAMPALAVYNQEVIVTGGPELASATITFESADGTPVTVTQEDDDDAIALYIAFDGNKGRAGNLNIRYPDGRTRRIALPATEGGRRLLVNATTGVVTPYTLAPQSPQSTQSAGPSVSAFYGIGETAIESIASPAGLSTAEGERPLQTTDDSLSTDVWGLQATFPFLGRDGWRIGGFYAHYEGDDNMFASSAPAPLGGVDNFIVFQQESDGFGTGFFGGLTPLESYGKLEIDGDKFGVDFSWPCGRIPRMTGTLGLYYQTDDIDQVQFDQFTTVDVGTERRLKVERDSWLLAAGGIYSIPFNDALSLNIAAGGILQFYDAELTSVQTIDFFGTTETLRKDDDDDAIAFGAYAGVDLSWRLGNFVVAPGIIAEVGTRSAEVKYPTSGDQVEDGLEVDLDNDSGFNWAATLRIGMQF
jgi:hypothetical protein